MAVTAVTAVAGVLRRLQMQLEVSADAPPANERMATQLIVPSTWAPVSQGQHHGRLP